MFFLLLVLLLHLNCFNFTLHTACRKANAIFWELVEWLGKGHNKTTTKACKTTINIILIAVPPIKHIQETKTMHTLTLQLLKHLCTEVLKVSRAKEIFRQSFITGAKYGIPEILEEIIKLYSSALEYLDEDVFKLAVLNHYEKIFNLICGTDMHRELIIRAKDDLNNILHLVGKLAPPHRLSLVSGAALQMQRELHWFKVIIFVLKGN